jgi:hypothetical protein
MARSMARSMACKTTSQGKAFDGCLRVDLREDEPSCSFQVSSAKIMRSALVSCKSLTRGQVKNLALA